MNSDTTPMHNGSQWRVATVRAIRDETPTVKTLTFELPDDVRHFAGQHYEVRLTAEDGYQAARLYSAASMARDDRMLELTFALVPDGEVTPYIFESVGVGTQVEARGPLGKFFVWRTEMIDPVLLVAGGSGVVPMRCMLQAHQYAGSLAPLRLLYSSRTYDEIIYKDELLDSSLTSITLTDDQPDGWNGLRGLIDRTMLRSALVPLGGSPVCYVCGRTPFVEAISQYLLELGVPPLRIKAERFGA